MGPHRTSAHGGIAPRGAGRGTAIGAAAASSSLVLAALPVFLTSGLAVQIRGELGFTEAALGAAVAGAFLVAAVAAPLGGRLADRIGATAAVLVGSLLSLAAMAGIAGAARSWSAVAAFLALSGLAIAVTDPGLAILVSRVVPRDRHGLAFGVKEASIPAATLAAGVAVPVVALTVGWRWAFTVGLVPLLFLLLLLPLVRRRLARPDAGGPGGTAAAGEPAGPGTAGGAAGAGNAASSPAEPPRGAMILVGTATALGCTAASGIGVFLTQSAVAMGLQPGEAGLLLAAGSAAGIVTRIGVGMAADRRGGEQFAGISWMLAGGAVAMALGAGGAGPLLVVATLGAFAGGWGWTGLLFQSLVRAAPAAPGTAAGVGVAGLGAGNAVGPLAFGLVAQWVSYPAAWLGAAALAGAAAVLLRMARPRLGARGH